MSREVVVEVRVDGERYLTARGCLTNKGDFNDTYSGWAMLFGGRLVDGVVQPGDRIVKGQVKACAHCGVTAVAGRLLELAAEGERT